MFDENVFESDLLRLTEYNAIEVFDKGDHLFIPYMMNDAVECYFRFNDISTQGSWDNKAKDEMSCSMTEHDGRKGLILRQGKNIFTIWYGSVRKETHLYQYHRIGHFWVKGQEKWRRIVYVIGTMHEKYSFIGEDACNELEKELIPLVGFAPFRYWTPLNESLDGWYPNTFEGIVAMRHVAEAVGDKNFLRWMDRYEKAFLQGKADDRLIRKVANELIKPKHQAIFDYITEKSNEASSEYDERVYDDKTMEKILAAREQVTSSFLMKGYRGAYPLLQKNKKTVIFYEEHPYIMREFEYEDFDFKIHALF